MAELDFSIFHPLDHWPWEPRCHTFYGGWWRHVYLWWEFQASEQLYRMWRGPLARVLCPLDHHALRTWHHGPGHSQPGTFTTACEFCPFKRLARPEEEFDVPDLPLP